MHAPSAFSTLVDAETLAAHLGDADWMVVDCRHRLADPDYGERAYAAAHLPGALFLHLDRDLSGPLNGSNGRHLLPDPLVLAEKLGRLGLLGERTQVVAYDDAGGMIAARLWWLLRWLGHRRVALLDGGFAAWRGPLSSLPPALPAAAADLQLPPPAELAAAVVDAVTIDTGLAAPTLHLIDARSPDRFRGENETIDPVGGHIPGARNRFFGDNLDAEGRFRPAAELRADFLAALDGAPVESCIMYCGSGVSACHNLLAMEIAGLSGARLYPGSWSEWCTPDGEGRPLRPVTR